MCLAVPGQILRVDRSSATAEVEFSGVTRAISLLLLDAGQEGEWVLVHAGFAIGRITAEEAATLHQAVATLGGLGEM